MVDEALEETRCVLLVEPECTQQGEDAHAALAGHAATGGDVLARLVLDVELEPLAAVRVHGALDELVLGEVAQAVALTGLEDDAGRTDELRHDDALRAVDDEGALVGHLREVAHEDDLLLDLAGVAVREDGTHEHRCREGHLLLAALGLGELRPGAEVLVGGVELELELQVTGVVGDRRDVTERLGETLGHEPLERLTLDSDEIGKLQLLDEVRERIAVMGQRTRGHDHSWVSVRRDAVS